MSFFTRYKFKASGLQVTAVSDITSAVQGTVFVSDAGAEYVRGTVGLELVNRVIPSAADVTTAVVAHSVDPSVHQLGNFTASTGPGVNADITAGYYPGSTWVDGSNNVVYFCVSNAQGAAVWSSSSSRRDNLTALRNPGVGDDISAGYAPGSTWINSTDNTVMVCVSNAQGAAVWSNGGSRIREYIFQGDGTKLAFTAADMNVPGFTYDLGVNSLMVSVGGVVQNYQNFAEVNNSTIQFTSPPPAGSTCTVSVLGTFTLTNLVPANTAVNWFAPTMVNGWAQYVLSQWPVTYGKDSTGTVFIKGLVQGGSNTTNSVIFTLPVGMRPSSYIMYAQPTLGGIGRVDIYPSGDVLFYGVEIRTGNATVWLSVNASFKAEQ